ncbi:cordon-bleu protein-like 1 [Solea solea]|uniref:cordon-bleu protein-like 1 n=1 Tax=Solea solea TaxID=90069 RepID=UPI00272C58D1|nr:cordon-bleu protein-like 1 [Solea solea]XP_058510083.1 cordon-bleu protein-like 1 [Solea solea]XP_058510092.1 cordon-bleu protein-like 1 [Solea solea]
MDEQENPLERDHSLSVVLPGGIEKNATVHGSKPVMDLLVTLCASYHLNPSDYTVEVLSPNKNNIGFKPNSPIGSLEAEKIVLKPKGVEEKIRRPYMPEATVRLLINYKKSHKAVVRVNPRVPLEMLLPVVCDKCEFEVDTTVLLRNSQSEEPLDLTKSLNEHGLREVFAKNTARKKCVHGQHEPKTTEAEVISPPAQSGDLPNKENKQKENAGFLSLFRRKKKKPELEGAVSGPVSPGLDKPMVVSVKGQDVASPITPPADMPKKRRAPQPPMGASQSVPNNLSTYHLRGPQRSAESTLRTTKRRAPPPPCANSPQELLEDTQIKGTVDTLNTLEEQRESDESDSINHSVSSSSSPNSSQTFSSSYFSRPSFDPHLPSFRGRDFADARCALAKVLTSSVSKGTLVKRFRNAATLPKLYTASSSMSVTQRCPDNGLFFSELESVLTSKLPTEPEWEDPLQRRGMTTFKVVPLNKQKFDEPEHTLRASEKCQVMVENNPGCEAPPEVENNQTRPEEDLCSSHRSDTETPLVTEELSGQEIQTSNRSESPPPPHGLDSQDRTVTPLSEVVGNGKEQKVEEDETVAEQSGCSDEKLACYGRINSEDQCESLQSPGRWSEGTEVDQRGSHTDETIVKEVVQEDELEEDAFPPPPPPVFFNEVTEDSATSPLHSSHPSSPTYNDALSEQDESNSALCKQPSAAPQPMDKRSTASSRFAQAVALAVQRSRLLSHGKAVVPPAPADPHSTLPSAPRSTYQFGA